VNQSVQGVDRMSRVDTTCIPAPSAVTLAPIPAQCLLHCKMRLTSGGENCLVEPGAQLVDTRGFTRTPCATARGAGAPAR